MVDAPHALPSRRRRSGRGARRRARHRAQGRGPAAAQGQAWRGRSRDLAWLLRDRQGARHEPGGGRQRDRRRVPPEPLLASATAVRPVRQLQGRSRRRRSAGWSTPRSAATLVPARARRGQDDLHRLLARRTSRSTSPITTSAARRSATRSRRSTARSATASSASTSSATGAPRTACCSPRGTRWGPIEPLDVSRAQRAVRPVPRGAEGRPGARGARAARGSSGSRTAIRTRARCGSGSATCRGPSSRRSTRSSASSSTRCAARAPTSPTCRA